MNKRLSILLLIFAITCTNAQEGYVKYKIEMSSESPEVLMGLAIMMKDSEMEISFKGDDSKMKMNMGSFMTIETVTKNDKDVLLLLSGIMIENTAVKTTKEKLEESEGGTPDFQVSLEKDTKDILGYTCKKALVTVDDTTLTFWYTDKIQMPKNKMLNANGKVPGMILAFDSADGEVNMTFEAIKVNDKIALHEKFSLEVPEGYTEKTFEDFKKMNGGM